MNTGIKYLSCEREMADTKDPYTVACNCYGFFQSVAHISACHLKCTFWIKMKSLYRSYTCLHSLIFFSNLHDAIANKINGSKFGEELNLMSFKLLAKSPNLCLLMPNFLTIQFNIIKNGLNRFHCCMFSSC